MDKNTAWGFVRTMNRLCGGVFAQERWKIRFLAALTPVLLACVYCAPWVQKNLVNALSEKNLHAIFLAGVFTAFLMLARRVGDAGTHYLCGTLRVQFASRLKAKLFRHLLGLPVGLVRKSGAGYLSGRLENDVETAAGFLAGCLFQLTMNLFKCAGALILVSWMDWRIGLGAAVLLPFFVLVTLLFRRKYYLLSKEICENRAQTARTIQNTLAKVTLIKTQAAQPRIHQRVDQSLAMQAKLRKRQFMLENLYNGCLQMLPYVCCAVVFVRCVFYLVEGSWSLGELWAVNCYLLMIFSPALALSANYLQWVGAKAAISRLADLAALLPERDEGQVRPETRLRGEFRFEDVDFGYEPTRLVFAGFRLVIGAGEHIALTGPSGCGKSTLAALMLRLYEVRRGAILLDSRPLGAYPLQILRSRIGYLGQISEFICASLRENLVMGRRIEDARIWDALEAVGMKSCVEELPEKLEQMVHEDGDNFSVGERLRLSFARELLRGSDCVILDEATASLDAGNEELIVNLAAKLFAGRTMIWITHRSIPASWNARVVNLEGRQ